MKRVQVQTSAHVWEMTANALPDNQSPLVSVIVPVYCGADFIGRILDSILNQSYKNIEVLVVDDGSTDGTAEVVQDAVRRDARVRLIRQSNQGTASARNLGIRHAAGTLIAPVDADDMWLPTCLEKMVDCLLAAPQTVGVVYAWSLDIDESDDLTGGFHASNIEGDVYTTLLCHYFPGNASCGLIRRQCLDQVGTFNCRYFQREAQGCEDWDLYLRLAACYEFRVVREFLVLYRKSDASISRRFDAMAKSHALMLEQVLVERPNTSGLLTRLSRSLFCTYISRQCADLRLYSQAWKWFYEALKANCAVAILQWSSYLWMIRWLGENVEVRFLNRRSKASRPRAGSLPIYADFQKSHRFIIWLKLLGQDAFHHCLKLVYNRTAKSSPGSTKTRRHRLSDKRVNTYDNRESLAARVIRDPALPPLPASFSVSIVVPTLDRPDCLRECLASLTAQSSLRQHEIIVVDNNPGSGITAGVVEEFPHVKLVEEQRRGASYARNAGITATHGDIIAFIDDDIVAPPQWLENIIAPLTRDCVAGVTGNVLPYDLDTEAAILFEGYADGGFDRGTMSWNADPQWFNSHKVRAVKTWLLGGTGNAAFRSSVFSDSRIGLFAEYLGAGMPSGGSEDSYLFYRTVSAGWTIAYEPSAFVWHKHRSSIKELRRQLYGYSKGFVSYHLTTLLRHGDYRAIPALLHIPVWHLTRCVNLLLGKSSHPLGLIVFEMLGHAVGPVALWRSIQRVKHLGTTGKRQRCTSPDCGRYSAESLVKQ